MSDGMIVEKALEAARTRCKGYNHLSYDKTVAIIRQHYGSGAAKTPDVVRPAPASPSAYRVPTQPVADLLEATFQPKHGWSRETIERVARDIVALINKRLGGKNE